MYIYIYISVYSRFAAKDPRLHSNSSNVSTTMSSRTLLPLFTPNPNPLTLTSSNPYPLNPYPRNPYPHSPIQTPSTFPPATLIHTPLILTLRFTSKDPRLQSLSSNVSTIQNSRSDLVNQINMLPKFSGIKLIIEIYLYVCAYVYMYV
jgi:hypothetical protein